MISLPLRPLSVPFASALPASIACAAFLLLSACGDDDAPTLDGGVRDSGLRDATIDAPQSDAQVDANAEVDANVCVMGAADPLDSDGFDGNCDGVDGMLADQVYVAADSVGGTGLTPDAPVASLSAGLVVAASAGRSTILVHEGAYPTELSQLDMREGVRVIAGGYPDGFTGPLATSSITLYDPSSPNFLLALGRSLAGGLWR